MGCSLPLTKLAQELHQLYLNHSQDTAVTETAIRNCIIELAARKCQDSEQGAWLLMPNAEPRHPMHSGMHSLRH